MCEVFKRFDTNNNGVITRTELATVLKSLDPGRWDEASVNAIVEAADVNKDGQIAYSEFVAWLSSGEKVGKDRMARNFIKGALEEPEQMKTMLGNHLLQHVRMTCPEFSGKAGAIANSLLDSMQPSELQCLLEQPPAIRDQVLRPAILQASAKIDAQRRAKKEIREKAEGKNKISTNVVWCAKTGLQGELQQLIMSRADVNVRGELKVDQSTSSNVTALQFAAACGHAEVVKMLLAAGANSNDRVVTVMATAGDNGTRPVATFSEGGSLYTEGDTALDLARKNGHTEAAKVLSTWQDLIIQFPFNESVRQLYERSSPTNSVAPTPVSSVAVSCLSPAGKSGDGPLSISKLRFGGDHYLSRALRLLQCTGPADVSDDTEVKLQAMQVEIDRLMTIVRNNAKANGSFTSQHSASGGPPPARKNLGDLGGQGRELTFGPLTPSSSAAA